MVQTDKREDKKLEKNDKPEKSEKKYQNLEDLNATLLQLNLEAMIGDIKVAKNNLMIFVEKIKAELDKKQKLQAKEQAELKKKEEIKEKETAIETAKPESEPESDKTTKKQEKEQTEKPVSQPEKTPKAEKPKTAQAGEKVEPKPAVQKPSSPKFEFKPVNKNENNKRFDNKNQQNNKNGKNQPDNKNQNFSRDNKDNRENKDFKNRDNKNRNGENGFNNRNNGNNKMQKNNPDFKPRQQSKDIRPNDPSKKNAMGKKPFEPKQTAPITEKIIVKETDRQFGNKKKTHAQPQEKKQLSVRQQMRMGIIDKDTDEDRQIFRRVKVKKTKEEQKPVIAEITHAVITTENLTVKILSEAISKPATEIIKKLFTLGMMCTINSNIDYDTAELVASDFGITLEKKTAISFEEKLQTEVAKESDEDSKFMQKRPPVVTVMGHVDHGKTSLLDAIRKTNVIEKEAGGITQHIGAYSVKTSSGETITFLDTPGHEAFTAMRERGAQVTDVAILIVAADDGIMPQTKESIRIIKEVKIPMVVAINKIDREGANIPRVLQQLADNDVLPEEWGGDVPCVRISAKKGENIQELLDMVILVSEMQELKANPNAKATGFVIESRLDKGLGPVATVIITNGSLKVGDSIVSGVACGRIRALLDENGKKIKKATPSMPVSILGLDEVPNAGDKMNVIDEKMLKQLVNERKRKQREELIVSRNVNKDNMFSTDTRTKVLSIIIKADVQGSAQAIKESIAKIENEEVRIDVLAAEVGTVTENDIMNASTSQNTMIICFNQKPNPKIKAIADRDKIEIKEYSIIYKLIDDVTEKAKSMMDPKYKEVPIGKAEVRAVFNLSSSGIIAGSYVLEGKIQRNAKCRVYRNKKQVAETTIVGLKNKKEDVKEIGVQFECGIKLENFNDVQVGDIIDAYILERIN